MPSFHDPFRPASLRPEGAVAPRVETYDPIEEANKVPTGTLKELKAWIGDDAERAERALAAEEAPDEPRSSVIAALKKIIKKAEDD